MRMISRSLLWAAALASWCSAATAAPVIWTDWTDTEVNTVNGSLTVGSDTIDVTYSGQFTAPTQTNGGTNYWSPSAPYVSATVDNAPPSADIIAINTVGVRTITFSQAVEELFIAIVSLNGNNGYDFGVPTDIISFGTGYWGSGTLVSAFGGNGVTSTGEGHGVIKLSGNFTSISFNATVAEHWNGFTIGVGGLADEEPPVNVPEPATLGLLGVGLLGIATALRRNRRAA
ncbi:PEP-CTERM sorting domain-containing protein [Rhodospirillaceae bacterium SYSU D60014]|uniref:PEP-CTERM sorting domain-containing protein n=1 Tax=Virgifigura deserti TaxID=2268457 RepID=UPI0013C41DD0